MRMLAVAAAVLLLAGCANGKVSATDGLLLTCEAYAGALNSLTPLKSRMKPSEVRTVDDVKAIVSPVCRDGDYTNPRQALAQVRPAVLRLLKLKAAKE